MKVFLLNFSWEIEIFSRTKSLEEIELKIDQWETAYGFTENTVKLEHKNSTQDKSTLLKQV